MRSLRSAGPAGYFLLAILLGGASSGGALANAALQLIGLAAIGGALWRRGRVPLVAAEKQLLLLVGCYAALGLLQLVPMPAGLWTHLRGREAVAQGFALLGAPLPAMPLSLWPAATLAAIVSLIPPIAMIVMASQASRRAVELLAWTIVVGAALSFLLGFAQLAGGQDSALYFYASTNRDQTVGFFANSNHLATLGVMSIPFVAALASSEARRGTDLARESWRWLMLGGLLAFLLLGVLFDGSVAGIGLLGVALVAGLLLLRVRGRQVSMPIGLGVLGALIAALALLAAYSPLVRGFAETDVSTGSYSRAEMRANTTEAIRDVWPYGGGLGSFAALYPQYEDPALVTDVYVNHAHNDYLEVVLETGIAGVVLIGASLLWVLAKSLGVWRRPTSANRYARAAAVSVLLALLHSAVDYPARTGTIAVLLAACCGLLARPIRADGRAAQDDRLVGIARHASVA